MPAEEITIAEMLRATGYATAHIGKWHLGYSRETMPRGQGFDFSFGHMGGCIDNYSHFFFWDGPNRHDLQRDGHEVHAPGRFFADLMVDEASRIHARDRYEPTFLYLFRDQRTSLSLPGRPEMARTLRPAQNSLAISTRRFLSTIDERIGRLLAPR